MLNLRLGDGSTPNRNSDESELKSDSNVLTRRFYIVDTLSGRTNFGDTTPVVMSFLQSATLRIEMNGGSNSAIRPPVLVLSYGERDAASIQDGAKKAQAHVMFKVEYLKDSASFNQAAIGLFITALVLGLLMVYEAHAKQAHTHPIRHRCCQPALPSLSVCAGRSSLLPFVSPLVQHSSSVGVATQDWKRDSRNQPDG